MVGKARDNINIKIHFKNPKTSKALIGCYQSLNQKQQLAIYFAKEVHKYRWTENSSFDDKIHIEDANRLESLIQIVRFVHEEHRGSSTPNVFWDKMSVLLQKSHPHLKEMRVIFSKNTDGSTYSYGCKKNKRRRLYKRLQRY